MTVHRYSNGITLLYELVERPYLLQIILFLHLGTIQAVQMVLEGLQETRRP